MKYLCTIFIAFFYTVSSLDEIQMTADIIRSYYQPTNVLVRVCWKTAKKRKLVQQLHSLSPPKALQFIETADDMTSSSQKDTVIVSEVHCPDSKEFFRRANITKKFRSAYRWLIINTLKNKQKKIPLELEDLNILVDSDVLFTNKNDNGYTLYQPYKCSSNSSWKLETFGTWTYRHGLNRSYDITIPKSRRRRNLEGIPIGTSFVINYNNTRNDLTSLRNLKYDHLTKTGYHQMIPLYYFMNATLVVVFTDDWGYLKNGTYNGMISDILQGRAELTGTVIFLTKARLEALEFISCPVPSTVKFVFRPPSLSLQNNLFVLPFKPTVWFCIFCLIFLLLLVVFINVQWENFKRRDQDNFNRSKLDMSEIVMMVIGAITQQGSSSEFKGITLDEKLKWNPHLSTLAVKRSSVVYAIKEVRQFPDVNTSRLVYYFHSILFYGTLGRVVMFLMFFVFLFLHTSYSANIVALLQSSSNDIKTLADLLNSRLELGAEDIAYNRQFMASANETIRKAIYERKIAPPGSKPNFMSLEEGVKRLQTKPFAFHMFLGVGYGLVEKYFLEHEKCGLQEIQFNFETTPYLTCSKNSPYKEIFKIGLLRNQEHGINQRMYRLVYSRKPSCMAHGGTFDSVNMIDFYPALLLLSYGIVASLIFLALEYFVSWRLSHK